MIIQLAVMKRVKTVMIGSSEIVNQIVVDSELDDSFTSESSGGSGETQDVGGDSGSEVSSGSDGGESLTNEEQQVTEPSSSSQATSNDESSEDVESDSTVTTEMFQVSVDADDAESEELSDVDSGTQTETFQFSVDNINDDADVSQNINHQFDEDGSITLTQEQLLEFASDVDGDDLVATNLQASNDTTVVDNGDGTFTINSHQDFNGVTTLSFDISDGTSTVTSALDLTVNPVNDLPVFTPSPFFY
ncbi:tandem-95 repeat protein (plasmid) [Vibrio sp. SS-MA-C1-2]|uniref:cadherin-like domain-containing protein n=1 Tax=Vibrio sp. SS-MA-C1-2 TaxID=2908646 RepID=UPI001F2B6616|nr:cadherin-like domain-containing protein [Vibrio sp. SS-MA-C1-2]UJF20307.1 tandem-95 repeat protein [Vibrio sp. SS-MA-C1-2]